MCIYSLAKIVTKINIIPKYQERKKPKEEKLSRDAGVLFFPALYRWVPR